MTAPYTIEMVLVVRDGVPVSVEMAVPGGRGRINDTLEVFATPWRGEGETLQDAAEAAGWAYTQALAARVWEAVVIAPLLDAAVMSSVTFWMIGIHAQRQLGQPLSETPLQVVLLASDGVPTSPAPAWVQPMPPGSTGWDLLWGTKQDMLGRLAFSEHAHEGGAVEMQRLLQEFAIPLPWAVMPAHRLITVPDGVTIH